MIGTDRSPAAFEAAVTPYEKQIYYICLRLMGNQFDAQDCAQEALLRAFRGFASFRGESALMSWLYTIANRTCKDAIRRKKVDMSLDSLQEEGWDAPDPSAGVYLQLEQKERKRLLEQAIAQLPFDQRQTIIFADLQGLDYAQAAQILDIPQGTFKSRLNRARAKLQTILLHDAELFGRQVRPIDERRG